MQVEAFIYNNDNPVAAPSTPEEIAQAKARYPHVPMRTGTRYLFFIESLNGFDPALNYWTLAGGYPWRFTLPTDGDARPDSHSDVANQLFPARPSGVLLAEVEQLIAAGR